MLKAISITIALFSLLSASQVYSEKIQTDPGWYPFVLSENLNPNSPANMGKLVLDPPAGKHGFVKTRGGHFYFEDGARAKFWGTNLCFSACFPTKEQAEIIADRLAFFGFNAVRLHHMDYYFKPRGIFEDIVPGAKDPQLKNTTSLSNEQLERLDYLIFQLKERGIYVDMNLLVRRHFTKADGVVDADKLEGGAKPVSIFDPKLIELQKQYAKDLLTHYNPYIKSRYCDDPAIALVEITNENSLIASWKKDRLNSWSPYSRSKPVPEYYIKELDKMWGKGTHRPLYTALGLYPQKRQEEIKKFYLDLEKRYFDEMARFLKTECGVKVPIAGIGGYQTAEDIEAQAGCDFIDKHAYWDHPRFPRKKWDKNDFTIHDKSMLLNPRLGLINNLAGGFIKNKPHTMTEWNQCYPNQYAYEAPVLMALFASEYRWDGIFQFAFSQGIKDEIEFTEIGNSFDIIADSQQLILAGFASFIFQKYERAGKGPERGIIRLDSPMYKGAIGLIKGRNVYCEDITFNADNNGAVILLSLDDRPIKLSWRLLLATISEVKNTASGWRAFKYNWGGPPVLLKKIGATITLPLDKELKVYALGRDGRRIAQVEAEYKDGELIFSTSRSNSPWFELTSE